MNKEIEKAIDYNKNAMGRIFRPKELPDWFPGKKYLINEPKDWIAFINEVVTWQKKYCMIPDGMLGPRTIATIRQADFDRNQPIGKSPDLTNQDMEKLKTCHPDLQRLILTVAARTPINVLEGQRSLVRQRELVASGASLTMNSFHCKSPSMAVDISPRPLDWNNLRAFYDLADIVKREAARLGIKIEWGGDWKKLHDCPHYQLAD
jgi:peptidoglycan L-alanyl-D-glutamate endopeptidase CwlK